MSTSKGKEKEKGEGCNVQVLLRCRPMNKREKDKSYSEVLKTSNARREVTVYQSNKGQSVDKTRTFTFDAVFGPESTQREVYSLAVAPIVEEVLKGFNCTIFAYGQTGTGKTYTMEGSRDKEGAYWNGQHAGVIPRAINQIFEVLEKSGTDYNVSVSFLELYNEELIDLLADDAADATPRAPLRIFDDSVRGITVHPLEEIAVLNAQDIFAILEKSAHKRQTAETQLNHNSSRSHCIFSVLIHTREITPEGEDLVKTGKLNLVDLAGSENIGRSGAVNQRKREAGMINQSLLTLGRVITALTEHRGHVPYRESKLTRILQDSLGGKTKTCIIATVSPSCDCIEETLSTLDYAHRAKNIKNRPEVNQKLTKKALIKEYAASIDKLKEELNAARLKHGVFLPKERYDSMEQTLKEQRESLDELEAQLQNKTQELEKLESMFEEKENQLREHISQHNKTKQELSETNAKLEQTVVTLESTKASLDEHVALVEEHEEAEEILHKNAGVLVSTLSKTVSHIDGLHGKLDRVRSISSENNNRNGQFKAQMTKRLSLMQEKFSGWQEGQCKEYLALEASVKGFVGREKEELSALKEKVDRMLTLVLQSEERVQQITETYTRATGQVLDSIAEGEEDSQHEIGQHIEGAKEELAKSLKALRGDISQRELEVSKWREETCRAMEEQQIKTRDFVADQEELLTGVQKIVSQRSESYQKRSETQRNIFQQFLEDQRKQNEKMQMEVTQQVGKMLSTFVEQQQAYMVNSMQQFCMVLQQADEDVIGMQQAFSEGAHLVQSKSTAFRDSLVDNSRSSAKGATSFANSLTESMEDIKQKTIATEEAVVSSYDTIVNANTQHVGAVKSQLQDCRAKMTEGTLKQEKCIQEFKASEQEIHSATKEEVDTFLDDIINTQDEWVSAIHTMQGEIEGFRAEHHADIQSTANEVQAFFSSIRDVDQPTGQTPQRTQYTNLSPSSFPRVRKRKPLSFQSAQSPKETKQENSTTTVEIVEVKGKKISLPSEGNGSLSSSGGIAAKGGERKTIKPPSTRSGSVTLKRGNNDEAANPSRIPSFSQGRQTPTLASKASTQETTNKENLPSINS